MSPGPQLCLTPCGVPLACEEPVPVRGAQGPGPCPPSGLLPGVWWGHRATRRGTELSGRCSPGEGAVRLAQGLGARASWGRPGASWSQGGGGFRGPGSHSLVEHGRGGGVWCLKWPTSLPVPAGVPFLCRPALGSSPGLTVCTALGRGPGCHSPPLPLQPSAADPPRRLPCVACAALCQPPGRDRAGVQALGSSVRSGSGPGPSSLEQGSLRSRSVRAGQKRGARMRPCAWCWPGPCPPDRLRHAARGLGLRPALSPMDCRPSCLLRHESRWPLLCTFEAGTRLFLERVGSACSSLAGPPGCCAVAGRGRGRGCRPHRPSSPEPAHPALAPGSRRPRCPGPGSRRASFS